MPGIGGTQRLTKIIGPNLASRYILTGDGFNGTDANRLNVC
jgi:enoyl-CoA hydratase/carnithine racemase